MTTVLVVLAILTVVVAAYGFHRWRMLYVGTEPLEQRLKRVGIKLDGDRMEVDGTTFTISEYRKVVAGAKKIYTRLEYRYRAPFLRSFHVARRPKEEMAVKLNADVMGEILSGNPLFDAIYVMRAHTREEILELLDEEFYRLMVEAIEELDCEVELFDSFMRWHIPGPPAFLDARYLAHRARAAARLATVIERARQRRPLPEPQATIYEAARSRLGAGELRASPDGGAEFEVKGETGVPVCYVLKHSDDGIHYRARTLEDPEHHVAISATTFTVDYPNREYHLRIVTTSAHYNVLVPIPIEQKGERSAIQAVMRQNRKRVASAYAKRMVDQGLVDTMEELLGELESLTSTWSQQRYPSLEVNSKFVRAYVPGPISESTPLEKVHSIIERAREAFVSAHQNVSSQVF